MLNNEINDYFIDEKAQLYYINKGLPTFAFEVSFSDRLGKERLGWLLNDELKTNFYMLIWPYASNTNLSTIKKEDFCKVDCLLIRKDKIKKYLYDNGWTNEKILSEIFKIRNLGLQGKISIPGVKNFYFYHSSSEKYQENPINIVIRKNILIDLADYEFLVTKDKLKEVDK